ncbi:MAG TPA: hypothetical protein VGJ56_06385 [Reyranella sp.]
MRTIAGLLLAIVAFPAYGQTATPFTCGAFKAESKRVGAETQWTVVNGKEKASEQGALKSGPVFECVDSAVLAIEFTTSAGHSFIDLRFPDGSEIGYGNQIVRRNNRFVLPIQAKPRIDPKYRADFDYHCKFELPGDPIPAASRADCVF